MSDAIWTIELPTFLELTYSSFTSLLSHHCLFVLCVKFLRTILSTLLFDFCKVSIAIVCNCCMSVEWFFDV